MTPPAARNPARHATGEMPLQSEASLKCRLQCLGPQAIKLLSKHRELPARVGGHRGRSGWAAAGAGILRNGWEFGRRASVEGLPRWTITVGNFFVIGGYIGMAKCWVGETSGGAMQWQWCSGSGGGCQWHWLLPRELVLRPASLSGRPLWSVAVDNSLCIYLQKPIDYPDIETKGPLQPLRYIFRTRMLQRPKHAPVPQRQPAELQTQRESCQQASPAMISTAR